MKIRDISNNDPQTADVLKAYDGVIIKATEGTGYTDPCITQNVAAAQAAGKPWGLYHYLSFRSDINDQIRDFRAQFDKYPGSGLRVCLDIEVDSNINQTVPADLKDRIDAFCAAFSGTILYANRSFIQEHLDVFRGHDVWQAEYDVAAPTAIDGINRIGWQYREDPDESDFTDAVMLPGVAPAAPVTPSAPAFNGDPAVLSYQRKLNRIQIPRPLLDEDGQDGPKTKNAVRVLEQVCALTVDAGIWGPQCESAYNQITAKPTLQKDSEGLVVRYLQYRLGITFDGIFGNQTDNSLRVFQRNNGLEADGICGQNTWAQLIGG
jgi:lysozyme